MKYLIVLALVMISFVTQAQGDTIYFSQYICLDGNDRQASQETHLIVKNGFVQVMNNSLCLDIRIKKEKVLGRKTIVKLYCGYSLVLYFEDNQVESAFLFGHQNYYFSNVKPVKEQWLSKLK